MPANQKVTRKLTAIMSADIKGYSILMADDEVFTIKSGQSAMCAFCPCYLPVTVGYFFYMKIET